MSETTNREPRSFLPRTRAEADAWNALSRDEQFEKFVDYLSEMNWDRLGGALMPDHLAEVRAEIAAKKAGEAKK